MHCCGLIKTLKRTTAENSYQEKLESFSFSSQHTSYELKGNGELDGGDRTTSGCLYRSHISQTCFPSPPKSHLNLCLQNHPRPFSLLLHPANFKLHLWPMSTMVMACISAWFYITRTGWSSSSQHWPSLLLPRAPAPFLGMFWGSEAGSGLKEAAVGKALPP